MFMREKEESISLFLILCGHFLGKVGYMQIQKKVYVKQVITETSKCALGKKFTNKMKSKQKVEERFQSEIKRREDRMTIVQFKLEQLEVVEIGQEIIEKEIDGVINVEVGMDWKEVEQQTSIVIQDDQVIRIDHA